MKKLLCLGVLLAIAVIYIISIASAIRRIVRTAEFAAEMIKQDMAELRQSIKTRGLTLGVLAGFLRGLKRRRTHTSTKK